MSFRLVHATPSTSSIASTSPSAGEPTIASTVLVTPLHSTVASPALESPAPSNPPISAWLDEDGMPSTQVLTFQTLATVSALNKNCASTTSGLLIPPPLVVAACNPNPRKTAEKRGGGKKWATE